MKNSQTVWPHVVDDHYDHQLIRLHCQSLGFVVLMPQFYLDFYTGNSDRGCDRSCDRSCDRGCDRSYLIKVVTKCSVVSGGT